MDEPMNSPTPHDTPTHSVSVADFNADWGITVPAELDGISALAPCHEPIAGLVTREVHEPEWFERLFG